MSTISALEATTTKLTSTNKITVKPAAEDYSAAIAAQPIPASANKFNKLDTQPFNNFNFSASNNEGSLLGL